MKTLFIVTFLISVQFSLYSQSTEFKKLLNSYPELSLPINKVSNIQGKDTISAKLVNKILFPQQEERAKFYTLSDTLINVTTYGKIIEGPYSYKTVEKKNGEVELKDKKFITKVYPLGKLPVSDKYHLLITKVITVRTTYIDLYVFNKKGKLLSLVNLYEADHDIDVTNLKVTLTSKITKDGIIKWHQEKYGVTTDRKYKLMPDGYFRVIKQEQEGEFKY